MNITFTWPGCLDDVTDDVINEIYEAFNARYDSGMKDLGACDPSIGSKDGTIYVTFLDVPGSFEDARDRARGYLTQAGWPPHATAYEDDDV